MAAPVVSQVVKTGAKLWLAPVGEALPDETTIAAGEDWGGDWEQVGFTKAPVTVAYDAPTMNIEVEEVLAPIDVHRIGETLVIETQLAELTGSYLTMAAGGSAVVTTAAGAGQVGFEEVDVGGDSLLVKWAVGIEGEWINDAGVVLPIRFFLYRATLVLNGELEFSKKSSEYVGIPLQITALANTEAGAAFGRLFKFQRVTAPATA